MATIKPRNAENGRFDELTDIAGTGPVEFPHGATEGTSAFVTTSAAEGIADTQIAAAVIGALSDVTDKTGSGSVVVMQTSPHLLADVTFGTTESATPGIDNDDTAGVIRQSGRIYMSTSGSPALSINRNSGGAVQAFRANGNASASGTISVTDSATTYNTSSSRSLKKNILPADSAWQRILAYQIRKFDWKVDDKHQAYGLIADEAYEVNPDVVSAPADEVVEIGELKTREGQREKVIKRIERPEQIKDWEEWTKTGEEIIPQGVDYSKLVPELMMALQEAMRRIEALEAGL